MCGIVFVGGSNLLETNVSFFESLLHADVVRGRHSTGVYRGIESGGTDIFKEAVPGPAYLELKGWERLRGENNTTYQKERLAKEGKVIPASLSNFYVGHNRYATQGAINGRNAHPFKHGDITLVHNGTLRGQWRLPDHRDFEVDSENICHALNKEGVDETIQKLQGAFTLVWHNRADQTLNFIRNTERPFYMMEFSNGMWAGASEKEMIQWLNNRRKAPLKVKQEFELPVGQQYVFDVSEGGFKFKEVREHKLPTFPYSYTSQSRAYWEEDDYFTSRYGSSATKQSTTKKPETKAKAVDDANAQKVNEILIGTGSSYFTKDKTIQFWPYEFREYLKAQPNKGSVRGWTMDRDQVYLEVEIHAIERADFDSIPSNTLMETTIVSAYNEKSTGKNGREILTPVAIGRGLKLVEEDNVDDVDDNLDDLDLSEIEMHFLDDNVPFDLGESDTVVDSCELCGSSLEEGDVFVEEDDVTGTQVFCGTCNKHYGLKGTPLVLPQLEEEEEEEVPETTKLLPPPPEEEDKVKEIMEDLLKEHDNLVESSKEEGGDSAEAPKKRLLNGWYVTQEEWENKVGFCGFCNTSIPWDEAETTEMLYQSQACCDKHYKMLMGE